MQQKIDEVFVSRLQLVGTAIIVVVLVLSLGYFYISQLVSEYQTDIHAIRVAQEQQLKQQLVQQVASAKGFLSSMRDRTDSVLKERIREQVDEAHDMAMAIYRRETGRRSDAEIRSLIVEALRPLRFFGGKGYFFVDGMDGQCILLPISPSREGTSLIDNRDDAGHFIMRGLIDAANKPIGEGFSSYRWYAPGNTKTMREKVSYVRRFDPYNWLIGTGQYVSDVEAVLKQEAQERLRTFRFGADGSGYMVVMTNDRRILVSPSRPVYEGKIVEDLPPEDRGVPNQIIEQAFEGDDFITYDWKIKPEDPVSKKLTYVSRMEDWGWILATGASLDTIEQDAVQRQAALSDSVYRKIRLTVIVLAAGLTLALVMGVVFSRLTSRLVGRYQADLERQNRDILHKAEELEHSNADLEQFAYVASHDLREPLRMVSSYMSLLQRRYADKLDADGMEFLAFAREGATRMDRLVLDLLDFSRIERRGAPLAPMDIQSALDSALQNLEPLIAENSAVVECNPALSSARIHGDEGQITRLLQNLIGNALKYRSPDRPPQIRISGRPIANGWEFSVSDNGIGIEPQYFERIFGIFQRLHTRAQYEGTGIGLAVCRKIVERHGGKIWLDSVPSQGTTFYFTVPSQPNGFLTSTGPGGRASDDAAP